MGALDRAERFFATGDVNILVEGLADVAHERADLIDLIGQFDDCQRMLRYEVLLAVVLAAWELDGMRGQTRADAIKVVGALTHGNDPERTDRLYEAVTRRSSDRDNDAVLTPVNDAIIAPDNDAVLGG